MKQRLIGAVVLVILAVIFLPMVFDGSSSTTGESVDLTIPDAPDRQFETRVLELKPGSPSAAIGASETVPAAAPDGIVTVDADRAKPADAFAGTENAPIDTGAYESPDRTVSNPPAAPTAGDPPSAATGPSAPATAATAPAPTTPSIDAPTATAAPRADARGRYAVSFGSYTKKENADALVAALKRGGVQAYAEQVPVNGQPGLRVRAGPFVDRAAAEETRLVAKRLRGDAPGTIVEIDETAAGGVAPRADGAAATTPPSTTAASATPSAAAGPARAGGWAVQVGAYKAESDAVAQRDKLRGGGFAAFVDPVRTEAGTMYRVRVGPEVARANADKLKDSIKARFALDGMVVAHP